MTEHEAIRISIKLDALRSQLASNKSAIGDWKSVKQAEYIAQGLDAPYTDSEMEEYYTARQKVRDTIDDLTAQLETAYAEGLERDE